MNKDAKGRGFILSTGKELLALDCVLGIQDNLSEMTLTITHGYDGHVDGDDFTNAELQEIAKYMIEQWGFYLRVLIRNSKDQTE